MSKRKRQKKPAANPELSLSVEEIERMAAAVRTELETTHAEIATLCSAHAAALAELEGQRDRQSAELAEHRAAAHKARHRAIVVEIRDRLFPAVARYVREPSRVGAGEIVAVWAELNELGELGEGETLSERWLGLAVVAATGDVTTVSHASFWVCIGGCGEGIWAAVKALASGSVPDSHDALRELERAIDRTQRRRAWAADAERCAVMTAWATRSEMDRALAELDASRRRASGLRGSAQRVRPAQDKVVEDDPSKWTARERAEFERLARA